MGKSVKFTFHQEWNYKQILQLFMHRQEFLQFKPATHGDYNTELKATQEKLLIVITLWP